MRAEPFVEPAVRALDQQIVVELARAPARRRRDRRKLPRPAGVRGLQARRRKRPVRRPRAFEEAVGMRCSSRAASTVSPSSTATLSAPGTKARITIPPGAIMRAENGEGVAVPGRDDGGDVVPATPARRRSLARLTRAGRTGTSQMSCGIFRDRAVGRKPADPGSVQDGGSPPCLGIAPPRVHRPLCCA